MNNINLHESVRESPQKYLQETPGILILSSSEATPRRYLALFHLLFPKATMKIFTLASASLGLLVAVAVDTRALAAATAVVEDGLIALGEYDGPHARANFRSLRTKHAYAGDILGAPDNEDSDLKVVVRDRSFRGISVLFVLYR